MAKNIPDIENILKELKERTVIVEGKKDFKALRGLGLKDVIPINGQPLIDIVQGIKDKRKEVVILTDFDQQGRKLNAKLLSLLHTYKIPTNMRLRKMFREIGKTRIEDFNGVALAHKNLKEGDSYGEISASINQVLDKSKNKSKGCNRKT